MSGGVGQLSGVALECRDPAALADFYSGLTGWPVVHAHADWYSVGESENAGFHLSFQRSPGHQPPTWPDRRRPCSFTCIFGLTTSTQPSEPCSPWAGRCLTISRATAPESTPIRQVIRSALSRPEIAPSSSRSGRPRHDRWPCRRPLADSQPPMRGTETVVRRISRSHRAGSLVRSTRREVR